jgi:hypothetical protein
LNGNWVQFTDRVSDERLRGIIAFLNAHALPVTAEMAMLDSVPECAVGIEGAVPQAGWASGAAERVHKAGGAVRIMRADDPWSSQLLAGNPCHWTAADVARRLAATAAMVRAVEPDVLIETTEVLTEDITQQQLLEFVDAYAEVAGRKLDGFVMDIDFDRASWGTEALSMEAAIKSRGIRFGVIYHGSLNDADDEAWAATTESRFADYELRYGGKPDEVLLESWMHLPRHVLPETQPGTFTNVVDRYFRPRPKLTTALTGSTVSGKLIGPDGSAIADAAIDAIVTVTSGGGVAGHYVLAGIVPTGATHAVLSVGVNEECNCNGNADLYLYGAAFTLGSDTTNHAPDESWFIQGTGNATLVASDLGTGQMLHVTATAAQMELIHPAVLTVSGGQTYRADFHARIPPLTAGTGAFSVIFLGPRGEEVLRQTTSFAVLPVTMRGATDGSGGYAVGLGMMPTNARVDVWFRGDDTYFPAYATP